MEFPVKYVEVEVEDKIIELREYKVILDSDVAALYGVTTKEINQAVKNNPEKFPDGYIFVATNEDLEICSQKFLPQNFQKHGCCQKHLQKKGCICLQPFLKEYEPHKHSGALKLELCFRLVSILTGF